MDAVARVRRMIGEQKVGHTGTLDPDATGVLPICLGRATKLVEILMNDNEKEYEAELLLGTVTDTQDTSGEVLKTCEVRCTLEDVRAAAARFVGDIMQLPPMYSAVKIGGKRLYEIARKGGEAERKERPVTIYGIEIPEGDGNIDPDHPVVKLRIRCSKGTYIRTLCSDIGEALGCGGTMASLVRTETDGFRIDRAVTLEELGEIYSSGRLGEILVPTESFFEDLPAFTVRDDYERFLVAGNILRREYVLTGKDGSRAVAAEDLKGLDRVRMYLTDGTFAALYKRSHRFRDFEVVKMFI